MTYADEIAADYRESPEYHDERESANPPTHTDPTY